MIGCVPLNMGYAFLHVSAGRSRAFMQHCVCISLYRIQQVPGRLASRKVNDGGNVVIHVEINSSNSHSSCIHFCSYFSCNDATRLYQSKRIGEGNGSCIVVNYLVTCFIIVCMLFIHYCTRERDW